MLDQVIKRPLINVTGMVSAPFIALKKTLKRIFGCWHRQMSNPVTLGNETYRTCANCGARRRFDLERWMTVGEFYRPSAVPTKRRR